MVVYMRSKQEEAKELRSQSHPQQISLFLLYQHVQPSSLLCTNEEWFRQLEIAAISPTSLLEMVPEQQLQGDKTAASMLLEPSASSTTVLGITETRPPTAEPPMPSSDVKLSSSDGPRLESSRHLQSSKVISSQIR